LELKHLASFVAVAEQLSFVRAAQQIHLSQPALSGQIRKLEEELGVQLFQRNRRTVRLTEAGAVFLGEARATLTRAGVAVDRAQKAAKGEFGRLRVGFVSTAALEIVPRIAVAYRKRYPEVALELQNAQTATQVSRLLARTLDVGLVRLPLRHENLSLTVIHREPFVAILPKGHALAKKSALRIADLRAENFVAYGRRWAPGFFDSVIQMCARDGFTPHVIQETGEMYTAIALVAAGAGIAVLPRSVVLAQSKDIAVKPLPASAGISEIALAMRADNTSTLALSFLKLARTFAKGL
jgi:DNA-binding transcriptional LysR family regulator